MRKYLLPEKGSFYKANLHSHTTVSDGSLTPAQLKALYKDEGYQILAYTDHEFVVDHSELDDESFLTITGSEMAFCEDPAVYERLPDGSQDIPAYLKSKTCEFNLFAKDQHNTEHVWFNPKYVLHGETWRADDIPTENPPRVKHYTVDCMNEFIRAANDAGFLVSLNHPFESMEDIRRYSQMDGLFAMEIINTICSEYNPELYSQMLREGKRISCIATDDCHSDRNVFGGFTMIKAENLAYSEILHALERGDFYASSGPLFEELYIEDGFVHIKCSPVTHIGMFTHWRNSSHVRAEAGSNITEARFKLPVDEKFIRFELTDRSGRKANTRGYFMDEIV